MENVIDGELILQFLDLELALQLEAIEQSAGTVESYLRQWIESVPMTTEERQVFDDYAQALADKYPAVAAYVFAKNRVEEEEEEEADGDSLVHDSCTKEPTRSSSETLENISDSPNASQESVASTPKNLPRTSQEVEDEDEEMQLDDTVEATGDEVVATEPDPAEVLKLWWAFGTLHNLLEFLRSLQWHQ
ncbi:hypothetical protein BGW41_004561 [Actinomortierella wolfii]|nr:hypothetical protein BGW41_004561 [Actinomortierella wolfii]